MEEKQSCVVVVPVHKPWPDAWERGSFAHLLEVYAGRPVCLVHPEGVSMARYLSLPGAQRCRTMAFASMNYISRASYNELLLQPEFYSAFMGYDYILLHHLDAWSFRDDVDSFIELELDYIGAASALPGGKQAGGLSLRRTFSCLRACRAAVRLDGISLLMHSKYLHARDVLAIAKRSMAIPIHEQNPYRAEDHFFTFAAPILDESFRVARPEQARRFGFDVGARSLFEKNRGALPMGCHAFWKDGNWEFWKQYIDCGDPEPGS